MGDAIVMEGVSKTFGQKRAVDSLDLRVPEGSLHGFIGPNGAGKTTSIRMIMSIIFPNAGRLSVLGRPSAIESKDRIGYLPEERGVYKKMKVSRFIEYMARLKGVDGSGLRKKVEDWLERVGLAEERHARCEELSKGMQQKVQFIASVIHEPELLILDEPFSGLDPVNMRLMRELFLEQHRAGRTMIFSTHVMHQAEELCEHVVMIDRGKKVLDASMEDIRRRFDPRTVIVEPAVMGADLSPLGRVEGVVSVDRADRWPEAKLVDGVDPMDVLPRLAAAVPLRRLELRLPTLEDVFVDLVAAGNAESRAAARASVQETAGAGVGGGE